jgi:hypothetical protein
MLSASVKQQRRREQDETEQSQDTRQHKGLHIDSGPDGNDPRRRLSDDEHSKDSSPQQANGRVRRNSHWSPGKNSVHGVPVTL